MLAKIVKLSCALLTPCYLLFAIFMIFDSFYAVVPLDQLEMISFYANIAALLICLLIFVLCMLDKIPLVYDIKNHEIKKDADIKRWEFNIFIALAITNILILVGDKYIQSLKIGLDISNDAQVLSGGSVMFWVLYLQILPQKNNFSPHSFLGAEFFDKNA